MDANQVIEAVEDNEEAIETAAKAIAEAGIDCDAVFAGGLGIGVLVGIALTKYVLTPVGKWAKAKWQNRPPKAIKVKVKIMPDPDAEETKEPETPSDEEKPEEK